VFPYNSREYKKKNTQYSQFFIPGQDFRSQYNTHTKIVTLQPVSAELARPQSNNEKPQINYQKLLSLTYINTKAIFPKVTAETIFEQELRRQNSTSASHKL
jgi:hypothetical protein